MGAAPRIKSRMQVGKSVRGSLTCWHSCRSATTGAWTCLLAWRTLNLFALPGGCPPFWLYITRHLPSWHWRQLLRCLSWPLTLKHMAPITQLAFRHRFLQKRSPHARTEVIVHMSGAGGWRAPHSSPPSRCAGSSDGLLLRLWLELALIWRPDMLTCIYGLDLVSYRARWGWE